MSRVTLYRADVESPRLAGVLARVPGVAVAADDETGAPDEPHDETAAPSTADEGGGLRERIPTPEVDGEETASVVRRYGLLGLGVSMVMLGVATVGIWVYRRRRGDEESETPPPVDGLNTGGATPTESVTAAQSEAPETATTPEPSIVRPDDESETDDGSAADDGSDADEPDRHGRTEGDRSDVEWTTREPTPAADDETTAEGADDETAADAETDDRPERPTESVDAAPLLGAAFLAVTGVVVRWLRGDAETE